MQNISIHNALMCQCAPHSSCKHLPRPSSGSALREQLPQHMPHFLPFLRTERLPCTHLGVEVLSLQAPLLHPAEHSWFQGLHEWSPLRASRALIIERCQYLPQVQGLPRSVAAHSSETPLPSKALLTVNVLSLRPDLPPWRCLSLCFLPVAMTHSSRSTQMDHPNPLSHRVCILWTGPDLSLIMIRVRTRLRPRSDCEGQPTCRPRCLKSWCSVLGCSRHVLTTWMKGLGICTMDWSESLLTPQP